MPFDPEQNWHNSGVVAFKNLATAQPFSAAWPAQFAAVPYSDRDEYSFGLALTATKLVVAPLANELNSFQQSGALIWHATPPASSRGTSMFQVVQSSAGTVVIGVPLDGNGKSLYDNDDSLFYYNSSWRSCPANQLLLLTLANGSHAVRR